MPNEYQRWGDPWNVNGWMADYYNRHLQMREELLCKSQNIRGQIQSVMGLGTPREVSLNIEPSGAGEIHLNTLIVSDSTWNGYYYEDVDIDILANAKPGYHFSHWGINNVIEDTLSAFWNGFINEDGLVYTAYFEEDTTVVNSTQALESFEVHLFPNPAQEQIQIISESLNSTVEFYDILGQKIDVRGFIGNQISVDIRAWSKGVYVAVIQDKMKGEKRMIQFIKE
jgi:hypothetical protein